MPKEPVDTIDQQMRQLIANVIGRSPEELNPEVNFWKDLGVDSIKAIEIAVAIERNFKISIRDEQIPKIATMGEAISLTRQMLEKKQKG